MKFLYIALISSLLCSCVKNEPFVQSYSVPSVYNYGSKDPSALARVIMMHGIENYLAGSVNGQLSAAILDSLWDNRDSSFTSSMVPNFLYDADILNGMVTVRLAGATNNADSMKMLADSVVYLSQYSGQTATNGVAGVLSAGGSKYLFDENGVEMKEVWAKAMLGAMCMNNALVNFPLTPGTNSETAWDMAYRYVGFPLNYEPSADYTTAPLKADRPLAIAALFSGARAFREDAKIYEEFRRGKTSALAGNGNAAAPSVTILTLYIEKTIAGATIDALDNVKAAGNLGTKLHYLSQAYGLVWALKYGGQQSPLTGADYWLLRSILNSNFYSLVQDASYVQINEAREIIASAFEL